MTKRVAATKSKPAGGGDKAAPKATMRKVPAAPAFAPLDWSQPLLGVGSVSTRAGLEIMQSPAACPADLIEVRVDLLLAKGVTLEEIRDALQARRHPALITPRIVAEGGKYDWSQAKTPEESREATIRMLLPHADALDLEIAEIESDEGICFVYHEALAMKKGIILSAHAIAKPAGKATWKRWRTVFPRYRADVYKIAGLVKSRRDLLSLAAPLVEEPDLPWAVMGMGEGAARMRMALTALGSKLIYGYLDEPAVASQPSLVDLIQQFAS